MSDRSFEIAQRNYDTMTPPDDDAAEIRACHEEAAEKRIAEDLVLLAETLSNSVSLDEYASWLYTHCELFRNEVLREHADKLRRYEQEEADRENDDEGDEL